MVFFEIDWIQNIHTHTIYTDNIYISHNPLKHYTINDPYYRIYHSNTLIKKINNFIVKITCKKCKQSITLKLAKLQKYANKNTPCSYCSTNLQNILYKSVLSELSFTYSPNIDPLFRFYYKNNNLTLSEFQKIKHKIHSINNNLTLYNPHNIDYIMYYETKPYTFSPMFINRINNAIYSSSNLHMYCDHCKKIFYTSSLNTFKNKIFVSCKQCSSQNTNYKIFITKNINLEKIYYNTRLELKLIKWANSGNYLIQNIPFDNIHNRTFLLEKTLQISCDDDNTNNDRSRIKHNIIINHKNFNKMKKMLLNIHLKYNHPKS